MAETTFREGDNPRLDLCRHAAKVIAMIYLLAFAYFLQASIVRAPVFDFLDWVRFWSEKNQSGDWLGYFWTPHNEHRAVISRLLLLIDIEVFSGTTFPFYASAIVLLAASVAIILKQAWETRLPEKDWLVFLLILVTVPTYIVVMCSMPAMGPFLHSTALAIFSLALAGRDSSTRQRVFSLVCAALSAFGAAGGILFWPVLAWYFWRQGHGLKWVLAVVVCGACFVASFLYGLPRSHISTDIGLTSILLRLDYVIRFLGLPWSHSAPLVWPSRLIGFAILAGSVAILAADLVQRRQRPAAEVFGMALVIFVLLTAATVSVARWDHATDREMPVRYAMFVTLIHAGLILALGGKIAWLLSRWKLQARLVILAFGLVFLVQQIFAGLAARRETSLYNASWTSFTQGNWTPDMTRYVFPRREQAIEALRFMNARKIYQ